MTLPFLFDLSEVYDWFTAKELTDMIAISESTPGPVGVNMATFAGFRTAGIIGGIIATLGLITPSIIIIIIVAGLWERYQCNRRVQNIFEGIHPAVIALISFSGLQIGKLCLTHLMHFILFAAFFSAIHLWKKSPIFYLCLSAVIGIVLKLE